MTLHRQVLGAAGLAALVGTMLAVLTMVAGLAIANWQRLGDLRGLVPDETVARCPANPRAWTAESGVFRIWAYDMAGRSSNPFAPPLPPAFGDPPAEKAFRATLPGSPWWRVGAAQRVADEGPCAVWLAVPGDRRPMLPSLAAASGGAWLVGLGAALAVLLGTGVLPVVRRILRVADLAQTVGTGAYTPLGDATLDAVGRIATTLDQAHVRIVGDREELVRRHGVLESHLAGLAHDLRTPLTALQLALEPLDGAGPARREVAYLVQLADNLHEASRLRGGLDVRDGGPVDLASVMRRVGVRFQILGAALETEVVTATPDGACWVDCAPALAERAMANLVHNAVVHGGSRVGVSLERHGDGFVVTVRDDGAQLRQEEVTAWSHRRLPPVPADPGNGLGLAIVGEVAHRAGWAVRFVAPESGGLHVTVEGATKRVRAGP